MSVCLPCAYGSCRLTSWYMTTSCGSFGIPCWVLVSGTIHWFPQVMTASLLSDLQSTGGCSCNELTPSFRILHRPWKCPPFIPASNTLVSSRILEYNFQDGSCSPRQLKDIRLANADLTCVPQKPWLAPTCSSVTQMNCQTQCNTFPSARLEVYLWRVAPATSLKAWSAAFSNFLVQLFQRSIPEIQNEFPKWCTINRN